MLSDAALSWLGNVAFLTGAVGMLLWLDWRLFLAAAALLPPAIWAIVVYRRRLEVRIRVMRERSATIGAFLIETLRDRSDPGHRQGAKAEEDRMIWSHEAQGVFGSRRPARGDTQR